MGKYKQYILIAVLGAVGYPLIEILWCGQTHWTMAVTGGVGFLALCLLETRLCARPLVQQALAGSVLVTALELMAGVLINLVFGFAVWDYSHIPGNFMGQICISYSVLWFVLCLLVMPLICIFRKYGETANGKSSKKIRLNSIWTEI